MADAGKDDKSLRKDVWRHIDWRPSSYGNNDMGALYALRVLVRALFSVSKTEKSERLSKDQKGEP